MFGVWIIVYHIIDVFFNISPGHTLCAQTFGDLTNVGMYSKHIRGKQLTYLPHN